MSSMPPYQFVRCAEHSVDRMESPSDKNPVCWKVIKVLNYSRKCSGLFQVALAGGNIKIGGADEELSDEESDEDHIEDVHEEIISPASFVLLHLSGETLMTRNIAAGRKWVTIAQSKHVPREKTRPSFSAALSCSMPIYSPLIPHWTPSARR